MRFWGVWVLDIEFFVILGGFRGVLGAGFSVMFLGLGGFGFWVCWVWMFRVVVAGLGNLLGFWVFMLCCGILISWLYFCLGCAAGC